MNNEYKYPGTCEINRKKCSIMHVKKKITD